MLPIHGTLIDRKGILKFSNPAIAKAARIIEESDLGTPAMDAAVSLTTVGNTGIPAIMTTYIDPKVIEVLTAPLAAAKIYPEVQKGDFTSSSIMMMQVEHTGETDQYGDFSEGGASGINANFPERETYRFQTTSRWGDLQVEKAATAKLDYVGQVQISSAHAIARRHNEIHLLGVDGLELYGLMNDPGLISASSPSSDGTNTTWALKSDVYIYNDVLTLVGLLKTRSNGLIDENKPLVLVIPPGVSQHLLKQNSFGQVLLDRIKKVLPNLRIEQVPEFATTSGNLVQLICEEVEGQRTGELVFCEKMRAHGVVRRTSSYVEKKTGMSAGAYIYVPFAVAQMLGV